LKSDSNAKGGLSIKKQKDTLIENQNYTCPNPLCGKIFTNPLKTKNLSSKQNEVYDACPYCLTEITVEKPSVVIDLKKEVEVEKSESEETSIYHKKEMPTTPSKAQECQHYMGYLSERSKADKIPEECMTCPKIVECMLKKVTG